jgi:hypothetical protein
VWFKEKSAVRGEMLDAPAVARWIYHLDPDDVKDPQRRERIVRFQERVNTLFQPEADALLDRILAQAVSLPRLNEVLLKGGSDEEFFSASLDEPARA